MVDYSGCSLLKWLCKEFNLVEKWRPVPGTVFAGASSPHRHVSVPLALRGFRRGICCCAVDPWFSLRKTFWRHRHQLHLRWFRLNGLADLGQSPNQDRRPRLFCKMIKLFLFRMWFFGGGATGILSVQARLSYLLKWSYPRHYLDLF